MRDMDLIRNLLLKLEKFEHVANGYIHISDASQFDMNDDDWNDIAHHMRLLHDAEFIITRPEKPWQFFVSLSWKGQDFLDSIRDDEVWKKTKDAASKVGGFTFQLLGDIATGFAKTKLKEHTGIDI